MQIQIPVIRCVEITQAPYFLASFSDVLLASEFKLREKSKGPDDADNT